MVLPAGQAAAGGGRLVFPQDPTVQRPGPPGSAVRNAAGGVATIYADASGTQLADIQNLDGTSIAGSMLIVDAYSRLPPFLGPDGADTVYISVDNGPVTAVYARADDRLDVLGSQLNAVTSGAGPLSAADRVTVTGNAGNVREVEFVTRNAGKRWSVRAGSSAESGGNAGSNFSVARYDDSSVLIDTPLSIDRKTGVASFNSLDVLLNAMGIATPRNHGLLAWTADPVTVQNYNSGVAGTVYTAAVWVPRATTITKLMWGIGTVGATPTAGANFIGLYDSAGNQIVSVNIDARVATSGTLTETFAPVAVSPGLYRVAWLFNAATMPQLFRSANIHAPLSNAGISAAANYRYATGPTAQTVLPASITPSSLVSIAIAFWAAIG